MLHCCKAAICWLLSGISLLLPLGRWLPEKACQPGLFNRYCISYTSEVRLQGEFTYYIGCKEITETFYLEAAAEPTEFRSFIDGFLDGRLAARAGELVLVSLDGDGEYEIESIALERVKPPKDTHLLLEDAWCQVGVSLQWGGALDMFVWKAAPAGFGNLINRADAGRLLQQSYYGTDELPYVAGEWAGTPWLYNPVQGGDSYGNCSKIVDYARQENQIYIKCRPMDWSKNGEPPPAYMENTYTLENGILTIDNRFTDFSGYAHPARPQEMPACYVVSALDTFNFYDGAAPWTDAALTRKSDLPFWGGAPECVFNLNPVNTETWCAWTQGAQPDAFGVSVYVPGTETLLAGRSDSKVTFDPNASATSYVAAVRTLRMTAEPFEYTYYLTAGTLSQMRGAWLERQQSM